MSDDKESNSRDLITGERLVKPSLVLRAGDGSGKRFAKIKGDQNFKAEGKKALKEAFDEAVKTYIPPQIDSKRTIGTVAEFYSNIVTFVKRPPERLTFTWLFDLFPIKTKFADAILLFVCKPDEAEVAGRFIRDRVGRMYLALPRQIAKRSESQPLPRSKAWWPSTQGCALSRQPTTPRASRPSGARET